MPTRRASNAPTNLKPTGTKNVRDPGGHPMPTTDPADATPKRRRIAGDGNMRLPHEHDETGDHLERAGGTDKLMEQAAADAQSEQQDTDRRSDAVEQFDHGRPPANRRGKQR